MSLESDELARLLALLRDTRQEEMNCDEWLAHVATLAEHELSGTVRPAHIEAVRQHLLICEECRDEYGFLKEVLSDPGAASDSLNLA